MKLILKKKYGRGYGCAVKSVANLVGESPTWVKAKPASPTLNFTFSEVTD
jgi:hypothetical protein